ncbi:MAG: hypothetical protein ABIT01_01045 [Thermoanaerobaculia bacterium]
MDDFRIRTGSRRAAPAARLLSLALGLLLSGCAHTYIVPAELRQPGVKRATCHVARTLRRLSKKPQEGLDDIDVVTSALTTPIKKLGISGWWDTGCDAAVVGIPVRKAQGSSGGYFTLDLRLVKAEINGKQAKPGRFLRIEIWPKTKAQEIAAKREITPESRVTVGGPVVVDTDGPFLEIHPGADFQVENGIGNGKGTK